MKKKRYQRLPKAFQSDVIGHDTVAISDTEVRLNEPDNSLRTEIQNCVTTDFWDLF